MDKYVTDARAMRRLDDAHDTLQFWLYHGEKSLDYRGYYRFTYVTPSAGSSSAAQT